MTPRTPTPWTRPSRLLRAGVLAATVAVGVAACGGGDGGDRAATPPSATADGGAGAEVAVKLFRYQPGTVRVRAGTTVTWRNGDAILHTVTAGVPGGPTGEFDEELADKGTSASVSFDSPGTFPYFCTRHPEAMRGEVTVTA